MSLSTASTENLFSFLWSCFLWPRKYKKESPLVKLLHLLFLESAPYKYVFIVQYLIMQ